MADPIVQEVVALPDRARGYLLSPLASAAQLHHSLKKYQADPFELARFARFLGQWPMFSEGKNHAAARRMVAEAIAAARRRRGDMAAMFGRWVADHSRFDDAAIIVLNDRWQAAILGIDDALYRAVIPHLDAVTSFFSVRSPLFDFGAVNPSVDHLRALIETSAFEPGGIVEECKRRDVNRDVIINVMADPRPSMLQCFRTFVHARCADLGIPFDGSAGEVAETLLRTHPPFGSIHRIIERDGAVATALRIDIRACNAATQSGLGLTFGFGRHSCPAGSIVRDALEDFWSAMVVGWSGRPLSYASQGAPGSRADPLRAQRGIFASVSAHAADGMGRHQRDAPAHPYPPREESS